MKDTAREALRRFLQAEDELPAVPSIFDGSKVKFMVIETPLSACGEPVQILTQPFQKKER